MEEVKERLKPVFGGLIDMHENISKERTIESEHLPFRTFNLISWLGSREGETFTLFALVDCKDLLSL